MYYISYDGGFIIDLIRGVKWIVGDCCKMLLCLSVKRKYRKLWRKASRALGREMLRKNKVRSKNRLFNKLRTKGKKPDEIQHLLRRACVVWYINSKIEVLGDN